MNNLPYSKQHGFTLIELLLVIVIMAIITVSILPISFNYKEKNQLEAAQINIESLIEFSHKQSTLNYERHQHGFTVSVSDGKLSYISRPDESSPPIIHKSINLPNNLQFLTPSSNTNVWFEKKTGFITSDSYINKIEIVSPKFKSTINITTSGIFSSDPIIPK